MPFSMPNSPAHISPDDINCNQMFLNVDLLIHHQMNANQYLVIDYCYINQHVTVVFNNKNMK